MIALIFYFQTVLSGADGLMPVFKNLMSDPKSDKS